MTRVKRKCGRVLSILLSLLFIIELIPQPASATETAGVVDVISNGSSYDQNEDSAFVLVNSDTQVLENYLPQTAYISEIESSEYELELEERDYPEGLVLSTTVGDPMVYLTQRWLNQEYGDVPGFGSVPENGRTGWDTVYGLLRALQHELGITQLTNNFGPTTTNLYSQNLLYRQDGVTNRMFAILQGALWCKGYSPGYYLYENADGTVSFNEVFNENVERAVIELKQDAGLINPDGVVTVNVMKALMSMDSFKLLTYYGGDPKIREMQQKLNRKYEAYTGLTPCDGVYGRNTNTALILALQCEEGLPVNVANGNFGVTTKLCCPQIPYVVNSSAAKRYPGTSAGSYYSSAQITALTELLQFALYVNGYGDGVADGVWDTETRQAVREFQKEMAIPQTGIADKGTWLSLFISCGDTNRSALAADCATILTAEKAATLYNNGYRYIGRYLTGSLASGASKAITREEAQIIFDAGLSFFPIFQTSAYYNSYFTSEQGTTDAIAAIEAANTLGLPNDTIIYFAVDYDCMDYQITSNVIPYFKSVSDEMADSCYRVGIYGTRNACTRVSDLGYACSSFVGDMSTGFSGNLGFSMPENWAFDQFKTITIGSGDGQIEIDKNGFSGKDLGVRELKPVTSTEVEFVFDSVSSDTMQGPTVNLLGHEFPLFELDVGFGLEDYAEVNVSYNAEKNEIGILIGYNVDGETIEQTGGKTEVGKFNQAYMEVKKTYSALGQNDQTFINQFRDIKGSLFQRRVSVGFDCEGYIFGFATIDCNTGAVKEGGIVVVATAEKYIKYPVPGFPILFFKFSIEGSVNGRYGVFYNADSNQLSPTGEISFAVSPKISAGADLLEYAYTYIGIMGTMECSISYPSSPNDQLKDIFEAVLSASVFYESRVLLWERSGKYEFMRYILYPQDTASTSLISEISITADDLNFIEPLPQSFSVASINNSNVYNDVFCQNVQVYCSPKIVSLGNGKMLMVYISDATGRTAINRTILMYSVYDGTAWSIPQPVLDDSTADFEPVICADGNGGAHIVWQNNSSVLDDDATLMEMALDIELYYTHWNGASFDNTTAITNNSVYEAVPKVVADGNNVTIVWLQNSATDTSALSEPNAIYRRQYSADQWQDIENIVSGISMITSFDTTYIENGNVVAYTAKVNTDSSDINNAEVFYYNGTSTVRVTNDSVIDYSVALLGEEMYWISDNSIVSIINGDITTKSVIISDVGSAASGIKVLANTDGMKAIVWQQESASGVNFYGVYSTNLSDSFSNVIPLSDDNGVIRGWDACILPNGQIEMAYCFGEKLDKLVSGKPYEQLNLMQKTANEFCDIYVTPFTAYSGDIESGKDISFYVDIYNVGSLDVEQLIANIVDENGNIVQSDTINCDLPVGDNTELVVTYTLPTIIAETTYKIQVYPSGQTDVNIADNEAIVTIGNADIAVKDISESRTESGRTLAVTVKNQGFSTISTATLKIFKEGVGGTLLETVPISELLPGEETSHNFNILNSEFNENASGSPLTYYFLLETDNVEADYGNNDKFVYVYSDVTIDIITGTGGTATGSGTYANGTTVTLLAIPNSGYIFDGWYENGLRLYEITEEYTVTTKENRTLEARFKENDLEIVGLEVFGGLEVGNSITFTATATGGIQPWSWEFYIEKDNENVYSNDMAIVNFFEWIPSEAGTYHVLAYVTDASGQRVSYTTTIIIT